jgi:hypothetical protein
MIQIQRQLMAKYSGPDDYIPEGISRDKFIPVVGVKTRIEERMVRDKPKKIEDIFLLIINDKGHIVEVSAFNCTVEINRKAEFNPDQITQILGTIQTLIGTIADQQKYFFDASGKGKG